MNDQETNRAAFLAWYELQCADNPQLRTAEARVLAWRAWQANSGANMGNSHVSAVNLPGPVAGQSRFTGEPEWLACSPEHVRMVLENPEEWKGYEVRYLYASPLADRT